MPDPASSFFGELVVGGNYLSHPLLQGMIIRRLIKPPKSVAHWQLKIKTFWRDG